MTEEVQGARECTVRKWVRPGRTTDRFLVSSGAWLGGKERGKGKGRQQAQGWLLKEQVSHMMESGLRFESLGAVYQL